MSTGGELLSRDFSTIGDLISAHAREHPQASAPLSWVVTAASLRVDRLRSATVRRRDILAGLVGLSVVMISPSSAQTPRRMRMGWLSASTPSTLPGLALLLTYLSALGWRAGETLEIVDRQAEGDVSKLPGLAAEIAAARPDVIACTSIQETSALRAATTDIPIVFHFIADPLALGIVTSLARPSGNITGIAIAAQLLEGKRLELLVDLLGPRAPPFRVARRSKERFGQYSMG